GEAADAVAAAGRVHREADGRVAVERPRELPARVARRRGQREGVEEAGAVAAAGWRRPFARAADDRAVTRPTRAELRPVRTERRALERVDHHRRQRRGRRRGGGRRRGRGLGRGGRRRGGRGVGGGGRGGRREDRDR